jgi:HK97 family phage prohead protease
MAMTTEDYIKNIEGAERRMVHINVEVRAEGDAQFFEGYGILYGVSADIGWFTEEIAPGAADAVLGDDVRGLFNHDPNYLLGRTRSSTMTLASDAKGVRYSIRYNPSDPDHVRVMEKVKRGDVSQSSFSFLTMDERWEKKNGKEHRVVLKLKQLIDMSAVTYPAYEDSTVAARSFKNTKPDNSADMAAMDKDLMQIDLI